MGEDKAFPAENQVKCKFIGRKSGERARGETAETLHCNVSTIPREGRNPKSSLSFVLDEFIQLLEQFPVLERFDDVGVRA